LREAGLAGGLYSELDVGRWASACQAAGQTEQAAKMWFYVNLGSLALGFAGSVLIYFFGVPRQIDMGGYTLLRGWEPPDEAEVTRIRLHKRWGTVGLAMLAVSFLGQLAATVAQHGTS
jgi:hypothetical protein